MERVAFLIEHSGERVFAMINPEDLLFQRRSGVCGRRRDERPLAAAGHSDDPMIYVGGGVTDLKLNLLFDVDLLSRSTPSFAQAPDFRTNLQAPPREALELPPEPGETEAAPGAASAAAPAEPPMIRDVRELSGPLWRLAENDHEVRPGGGPPIVRFIWGSAWNVPCIALRVAERFDLFSAEGVPLRSWMRIHLRRTHRPEPRAGEDASDFSFGRTRPPPGGPGGAASPEAVIVTDPTSSSRPDLICESIYGDLRLLHPLLDFNGIDDFWSLGAGSTLLTPPAETLRSAP